MHTQTSYKHCGVGRGRRELFSAFRLQRRTWRQKRRRARIARRLALTNNQQDRLDALLSAFGESRARAKVAEVFRQLDELLQQSDSSSEALATILRGGLKKLDTEIEGVAARASEFLESLDNVQRDTLRDALRQRLR